MTLNNTLSILLIEDNRVIAQQLIEFFEGHQWRVDYSETGQQGIKLAYSNIYDIVILDLNLPDIDGIEVCQKIKQESETNLPILMLTARDSFEDKAAGFGEGADDYVTKPFEFRELALRCQALTRRHQLHQKKHMRLGELSIDQASRTATRNNQALSLTIIGYTILLELAKAHPKALSRSVLQHKIWGEDLPESDALRSHIYALRNALDKPYNYPMLMTITNVGYKLEVPNAREQ